MANPPGPTPDDTFRPGRTEDDPLWVVDVVIRVAGVIAFVGVIVWWLL